MRPLLILFVYILVAGCSLRIDKPPSSPRESWTQSGYSLIETQKALLECGYFEIYSPLYKNKDSQQAFEDQFLASRCMENAGFKYDKKNSWCNNPSFKKEFIACAPDTIVPERNVTRRLNSWDCKNSPKAEACQP